MTEDLKDQNEQQSVQVEDPMKAVIGKISDLPTIPSTLMSIWAILESPDSSTTDLGKVISLDQALTAKIIRLANSPFYHIPYEISSVKSAVVNVGFEAVKNMVIAVSVTSVFKKMKGSNKYFPLKDFWKHSVGVGVASRMLAKKMQGVDGELCFCSGILHDIGKFALNLLLPEKYAEALSTASREDIYIHEAERKVISTDHAHVGELFARHWNFSGDLQRIIGDHHKEPAEIDDRYLLEASIVNLANNVIRDIQYGFPGDFKKGMFSDDIIGLLGIDNGFLEAFKEELFREIEDAGEILNLL